ncbi:hypothetical protein SNL152K_4593 [Streptomyces sp. NL15-2K]|nr:hypothetical protein SNL152K_4593 [Streptomyces sp. NL15-2K]
MLQRPAIFFWSVWGRLYLSDTPMGLPCLTEEGDGERVRPLPSFDVGESGDFRINLQAANLHDAVTTHPRCSMWRPPCSVEIYRAARPGASPGDLLAAVTTPGAPGPPGCAASTIWSRPTTVASARATGRRCRSSSGPRATTAYGCASGTIPRRRQPPQHTRRGCPSPERACRAGSPMTRPAAPRH